MQIRYVKADVQVLINLWNYTNPNGKLANNQCCDYSQGSQCSSQCFIRTKICLDYVTSK